MLDERRLHRRRSTALGGLGPIPYGHRIQRQRALTDTRARCILEEGPRLYSQPRQPGNAIPALVRRVSRSMRTMLMSTLSCLASDLPATAVTGRCSPSSRQFRAADLRSAEDPPTAVSAQLRRRQPKGTRAEILRLPRARNCQKTCWSNRMDGAAMRAARLGGLPGPTSRARQIKGRRAHKEDLLPSIVLLPRNNDSGKNALTGKRKECRK
jgi:hypothetical protein